MKVLTELFKTEKEVENTTLPPLEELPQGLPMSKTGLVINPDRRQSTERALGRIYRLFMKMEELVRQMKTNQISSEQGRFKYGEVVISFNRYTAVLRSYGIEIPQNREQWLVLFKKHGITR